MCPQRYVLLAAATGLALVSFTPIAGAQQNKPAALQCDTAARAQTAGGASITDGAATAAQKRNWQPSGGEITFTIRSTTEFSPDASVLTCFRWRTADNTAKYVQTEISRTDLSDRKIMKVTTVVPNLQPAADKNARYEYSVGIVPLADVRILIAAAGDAQPIAVSTIIGITNPWIAGVFTIAITGTLFLAFAIHGRRRLQQANAARANLLLSMIATPSGYASLSQFQIVLWTVVVAASAIYVMILSGELIQITTGTLVLLGISGAAAVGTRLQSAAGAGQGAQPNQQQQNPPQQQNQNPPPQQQQQQNPPQNQAQPNPPPRAQNQQPRVPVWSDLIMSEDGTRTEIDVTRVQMLCFTIIAAAFVAMRVAATYVIPDVPDGFQILMGISNGVYFTSKLRT